MDKRSTLQASLAAFAGLVAWWGGLIHLDGALAVRLPYEQYETVALLYPDVFYPALPGLYLTGLLYAVGLAGALGGPTYVVSLLGWTVALSAVIGAVADRYVAERGGSPTVAAVGIVAGLFVAATVAEAVLTLA